MARTRVAGYGPTATFDSSGRTSLSTEKSRTRRYREGICRAPKTFRPIIKRKAPEDFRLHNQACRSKYGPGYFTVCQYNAPKRRTHVTHHCRGAKGMGESRKIHMDKLARYRNIENAKSKYMRGIRAKRSASARRRSQASRNLAEAGPYFADQYKKAASIVRRGPSATRATSNKRPRRNRELAALGNVAVRKSRRLSSRR